MKNIRLLQPLALALAILAFPSISISQPYLGDAPKAPDDVSGLPGGGPMPLSITGGFSVNTDSREEVRNFYNAVFSLSQNVAMNTTANVSSCTPGTNGTAFQDAVARQINWFRAMGGVPASVTLNAVNNSNCQQMAVMISANNALSHFPPSSWSCFTSGGANAASNSDIAIGNYGPDAISAYIWDFGANNTEVGHRRWILYPQTQIMATGDVPQNGSYYPANATWVFDANLFGPRPATRKPYVSWPPEGYCPYQVAYPQWSFALSNADFSAATVTMLSNGVAVAVSLQPYLTGYGDNTLVWVPMGLDATSDATTFPFSGTDTVYSVTVGNIKLPNNSFTSFSYNVTVIDPTVPGTDYVATTITGPSQPVVNAANLYNCAPANNPHVTGYQWLVSQTTSGNFTDNATQGLTNFTISPTPTYSIITNASAGSGNCFHLCHVIPVTQLLQMKEIVLPKSNSVVTFNSLLGYATTDESARVQASIDGVNWKDLYVQYGTSSSGQTTFTPISLSLSNYASVPTLLRFNFQYVNGYYGDSDNYVGWEIQNVSVANALKLTNMVTNITASASFTYTPTVTGAYELNVQPLIFTQFPLAWGPGKAVTSVPAPPIIVMGEPVISNNVVKLSFTVTNAPAVTYKLLQANQPGGAWITNTSATLTTNVLGSSYRFTTTNGPAVRFYRVQTP